MSEQIGTNDLINELGRNFIEYAYAVNTDRSIPDAMSGLKPVARRILWSMFEEGRTSSKPHVKAARVVGDVMGRYHPHGDSSIYGAMVRLAQNWVLRYPLIDFHGNCGNIAGDGPAASRYTEARLTKIAEDGLLAGIKKKNVDFILNYDETLDEPITLPAIFPNLLCNPNNGIGVAMACNWLPHNLCEVAQAIHDYTEGKEPMLPGPDFPTGGIIINKNELPTIVKNGRGSVKVRGKYKIEKNKIIFYEIPYGTTIEKIIEEIGSAADDSIKEIVDVHDESNKKGIRIVIEVDKNTNPESIVNQIFAKTNLQTSISYNQVALIDKTPTELTLKDCIKVYIDFNIDCLKKECEFDKKAKENRLEVVEGLIKALEDIDNIIKLIKGSESAAAAKISLIQKYNFTENQAKAILGMKLSSLARLESIELNKEAKQLKRDIETLKELLSNKDLQLKEILSRLDAIVKKYGDKRRTEIVQIDLPKNKKEKEVAEVVPEDVVVVISKTGMIKRIPRQSFKTQRRNGKGVKNEGDLNLETISTNTVDNLMFFTDKGKMYRLLVDKVPVGNNTTKGTYVGDFIKIEPTEKVIAVTSLHKNTNAQYVLFITKKGMVKKTYLKEYTSTNRNNGIIAIKLKDNDTIANVTFINEEKLILLSKNNHAIRFETKNITPIGRNATGVIGMKLIDDDEIITGLPIKHTTDDLAVFNEMGLGKKIKLSELPSQNRGGKGVLIFSKGNCQGGCLVDDKDKILILGQTNSICIESTDVPTLGRTADGNIMIKGTRIKKVIKI